MLTLNPVVANAIVGQINRDLEQFALTTFEVHALAEHSEVTIRCVDFVDLCRIAAEHTAGEPKTVDMQGITYCIVCGYQMLAARCTCS